jgi:hypothetical protein
LFFLHPMSTQLNKAAKNNIRFISIKFIFKKME